MGSGVCETQEGDSEESRERESISLQISSSIKPLAYESSQAYTSSQLTLSNSSKIANCLCRLKIFNSTVMFPKDSFSIPFLQLIRAFEVVRKGQPRMTDICASQLVIDPVYRTTKSTGYMNSPTLIKTSSTKPLGALVERSVNWKIILVGFNSPNPSFSYTEYGSKLTLAPKSNNAGWSGPL